MQSAIAKKGAYGEGYILHNSQNGEKTQRKTQFYLAYTDTSLRIKIECEVGEKLHCPYNGYNELVWKGDVSELFISPYGDEHSYFELDLAPNLSCFYAHIYNPDGMTAYCHFLDTAGIDARCKVAGNKWIAEMEIPFDTILKAEDLHRVKELPWRFNVFHVDDELQEFSSYSATATEKPNFHVPAAFAQLIFE